MSNNCSPEASSSSSLRNSSRVPVTSPTGLCSTETRCRDAPCSPTNSLGSNTSCDNCHEPCGDHRSCQATSCDGNIGSPSVGSPVTSGISASQEGNSCLPVTSCNSSCGRTTSCRQPLSCYLPSYQSYGCQPLGYLAYGRQPLSCLLHDRPPLRNLTHGCQPFSCIPDYYRPTSYTYGRFQPYFSSLSGWRYSY
ncbi:keratin-associated protein 26-1 [Phodopus roborovskii]|uniref:Keratin-associated protein n=1 Tax=Phodopus roborovskii TaxID=109678 RepID=A0AAU9ZK99_PHORO|nr:keratin-associated protein 26-1 [Phodopus roborovskii]CAH6792508.1 2310079G19Rik [Phodopus roborovskii]